MKLKNIYKAYGDNVVFEDFNFEIEDGKITALLGASGCGKSTLLKIIGGLTDYKGECPEFDKISYIFQEQRLIPNLTVFGNLEYVLSNIKDKTQKKNLIMEILNKVELSDSVEKYPSELSGGMAQRVALARAFAYKAPLLLMDEPFKGLDVSLKKRIIEVFKLLYADDNRTVLFVTHDIDEALALSDRIKVMEKGGKIIFDTVVVTPRTDRKAGDFGNIKNDLYSIL